MASGETDHQQSSIITCTGNRLCFCPSFYGHHNSISVRSSAGTMVSNRPESCSFPPWCSLPSARFVSRLGSNGEMSDMANAGQSLSTKSIAGQSGEVFKRLDFGGCEAFAQNWQVCFLLTPQIHNISTFPSSTSRNSPRVDSRVSQIRCPESAATLCHHLLL